MNSLGIKRDEGGRQLSSILLLLFPHLASLSILLFVGIWARSPFASPIVAAEIHPALVGSALSPFVIFAVIAYVVLVSVFLALSRFTALKSFPIKKHYLVAFCAGLAVFLMLSGYWSHLT